ncbi:outer membrane lipoprotein-sorting protein [bacterium]|nr:outer membrane lipoprotein-sorting protein [bacterium]
MRAATFVLSFLVVFLICGTLTPSLARADAAKVETLMKASDRYRGGLALGVTWDIQISSVEDGETNDSQYTVRAKGVNALAECQNPPRCKGEVVLFNNRNLWFLKPGVKKPVAISPRQRLSGQAANGDIASTNYARDYNATLENEELVGKTPAWRLLLKARDKNVTYDKIRYWISKDKMLGLKAEFLTLSGEVFKSATFDYGNTLVSGGKKIPFVSRMLIVDAAFPKNVTTITYISPREEAHDDSIFNINNVAR